MSDWPPLNWIQRQTIEPIQGGDVTNVPILLLEPRTDDNYYVYAFGANQDDLRKIFSACQHGIEYLYGDDSNRLLSIFEVGLMSFCGRVADCIDSSTAVQQAINNYLQITNGGTSEFRLPDEQTIISSTCDEDELWGQILATLDYLADTGRQYTAQIIDAINSGSQWAAQSRLMPQTWRVLPINVQGWVDTIEVWGLQAWDNGWTPSLRLQLACAIHCQARCKCQFGLGDVGRALSSTWDAWNTLDLVISGAILQSVSEALFVRSVMATIAGAMAFTNGTFEQIGLLSLRAVALQGIPDNGHLGCTCSSCCNLPLVDNLIGGVAGDCTSWDAPLSIVAFSGMPLNSGYALRRITNVPANSSISSKARFTLSVAEDVTQITLSHWSSTKLIRWKIEVDNVLIYNQTQSVLASTWLRTTIPVPVTNGSVIEISMENGTIAPATIQHRLGEFSLE